MKRSHSMPFGAACQPDGSVRFRLWAPAARSVEICIRRTPAQTHSPQHLPMQKTGAGWYEIVTDAAASGSQYQFRINEQLVVPDPASRFQPADVHGPSEVIDPQAFDWQDEAWRGRPWSDAVIYELHVGAFTPRGTFSALRDKLDYLSDLGITAIELMPIGDFPGQRNWGYDGVLPFAPDASYGRPDDLKDLVQSAHRRGLMVLLDVVYNHFGPEGNYLASYAPDFFTDRHCTPWGNGINFDGVASRPVRDFFIQNALYWLTEYHFDGLRLDAVHAIADTSSPHLLTELADVVRNSVRRSLPADRHVHLILENEHNQSRYLQLNRHCQPREYTAQWNDDIHHALHVLLSDERDGYYSDYSDHAVDQLGRCLVEGFAFQGEPAPQLAGKIRGEPTTGLPPAAFVSFLQNHDQIGNRAFAERITRIARPEAVRAAMAILLLAPSPPLLFMGEEFAADTPFLFFCDFGKDLAAAVTEGRRNDFAHFRAFADPSARERIPDPNAPTTFAASRLDWSSIEQPCHADWLRFYRHLLALRREHIVPHLAAACALTAHYETLGDPDDSNRDSDGAPADRGLSAHWQFPDGSKLFLLANLGASPLAGFTLPAAPVLYSARGGNADSFPDGTLPPWSVEWFLAS